jgi:hypothetical protein
MVNATAGGLSPQDWTTGDPDIISDTQTVEQRKKNMHIAIITVLVVVLLRLPQEAFMKLLKGSLWLGLLVGLGFVVTAGVTVIADKHQDKADRDAANLALLNGDAANLALLNGATAVSDPYKGLGSPTPPAKADPNAPYYALGYTQALHPEWYSREKLETLTPEQADPKKYAGIPDRFRGTTGAVFFGRGW